MPILPKRHHPTEKGGITLQALLVLEDGFSLRGKVFSGGGERFGEVVFNTAMTGYQEMITDPSYRGQILAFTHPHIGNYGINMEDIESDCPQVEAVLVKESCRRSYSRRAGEELALYLDKNNIPGVEGIDTRTLTLHLRQSGTLYGAISTVEKNPVLLRERVVAYKESNRRDLVKEVATDVIKEWPAGGAVLPGLERMGLVDTTRNGSHIVVYDFGIKYNILRHLAVRGCRISLVPYDTPLDRIYQLKPDGIVLSNGPGDPSDQRRFIPALRELIGHYPIFGICLGHQLLALALGHSTYKLSFGHRGVNHPVKELETGKVKITSQNHGYCVRLDTQKSKTIATHINLNDGTIEGLADRDRCCFSVQFHPEASSGPHDTVQLFDRFLILLEKFSSERWI